MNNESTPGGLANNSDVMAACSFVVPMKIMLSRDLQSVLYATSPNDSTVINFFVFGAEIKTGS